MSYLLMLLSVLTLTFKAWTNEEPHHTERRKPAKCTNIPIMQQIMNKDDGLNITGLFNLLFIFMLLLD